MAERRKNFTLYGNYVGVNVSSQFWNSGVDALFQGSFRVLVEQRCKIFASNLLLQLVNNLF